MLIHKHGQRVLGALRSSKAFGAARRWLKRLGQPPAPNYLGDRYIEYSFAVANMPDGPGKALDFGCGPSSIGDNYMGLVAARKDFCVTAYDLQPIDLLYTHPNLKLIQGDILKCDLAPEQFDVIIDVSVIEHIGLTGSYGVAESDGDGDIRAMAALKKLLKKDGIHILTIPVGPDKVFHPWHRVYGSQRLPRVLDGWQVSKQEWWVKDLSNRWISVDRQTALARKIEWYSYGLGLFVLRK